MNWNNEEKRFITSNNDSEQIMKLTHSIHVCLIIFLIHYFDIINLLKSDKIHCFDSVINPTHYALISVTWAIIISFMYQQMWNEKHAALLIFFAGDSGLLSICQSLCLYETNYLTKGNILLHIQFLKLVYSGGKITFSLFFNKHEGEEAKMLLKLIVVDSYHFIRWPLNIIWVYINDCSRW